MKKKGWLYKVNTSSYNIMISFSFFFRLRMRGGAFGFRFALYLHVADALRSSGLRAVRDSLALHEVFASLPFPPSPFLVGRC